MTTDIFCKIASKELGAEIIEESNDWIVVKDIHPAAPTHVLIVPKRHGSIVDYKDEDAAYLGKLIIAANRIAKKLGVDKTGFRLVINYGEDSQAHVLDHMHIHLLAGKKLGAKIVADNK